MVKHAEIIVKALGNLEGLPLDEKLRRQRVREARIGILHREDRELQVALDEEFDEEVARVMLEMGIEAESLD